MTDSNVIQTAQVLSERYGPSYRWLVTITGMVGVVSMVLAMTTVNVAVPDVMGAFGIGQDKAQWMSSAYMATMTAGMLINAWLTGIFGERRIFVGALFFFSIGALLGGTAPTEDSLIFARVLQGFSAGVSQPLVMATIFTVFPPDRRGMAMGVFGLGVVFAPAIGPTMGGMMIEYFSWRYVFYISLPFCALAAVLGLLFMPTRRIPREIPPFDWLGFFLLCAALLGLMTGIADGQREGWASDAIVFRFVVGGASLVGFVLWELRADHPMLDPRLFRLRGFGTGSLVLTVQFFGSFGLFFVLIQYLQYVAGLSPLESAAALLPLPVVMVPLARNAPRIAQKLGPARVMTLGLVLSGTGMLLMRRLEADFGYGDLALALVIFAAGMGLAGTPATTAIVSSLPDSKQGVGSAVNDTARELGSVLGIAVLGSALNDAYRSTMAQAVVGLPQAMAERVLSSVSFVKLGGDRLDQFGPAGERLVSAAQQSFVEAASTAFLVAAVGLFAGAVVVAIRAPRRSEGGQAPADRPAEPVEATR